MTRKLNVLLARRTTTDEPPGKPEMIPDFIVNMSRESFSDDELACLNRGLNFAITPKSPPVEEIIIDLQVVSKALKRNLDYEEAPVMRMRFEKEAMETLEPIAKKRGNTTFTKIIDDINKKKVQIVKADKGNKVVVLNTGDYEARMKQHIDDGPYSTINNPINKAILDFRKTIKKLRTIDVAVSNKWRVPNPSVPKLYGLPKIHKTGPLKMRPIVSNIGAVTEKLSKWLVATFRGLGDIGGRTVKNALQFVDQVKDVKIKKTESIISFDIVSLFPSIPVDLAITFLEEWLLQKKLGAEKTTDLVQLTSLCMRHNNFGFRDKFYTMDQGTAMVNAMSPFLAEIVLSRLENELATDRRFPRVWTRYVDDIFAVVPSRQASRILQWLNASRFHTINSIQFIYFIQSIFSNIQSI